MQLSTFNNYITVNPHFSNDVLSPIHNESSMSNPEFKAKASCLSIF